MTVVAKRVLVNNPGGQESKIESEDDVEKDVKNIGI